MKPYTSARAPDRGSAIDLEQRASRAAESILEDESLTSDLDDVAAKVLLDWGLACAKAIAAAKPLGPEPTTIADFLFLLVNK